VDGASFPYVVLLSDLGVTGESDESSFLTLPELLPVDISNRSPGWAVVPVLAGMFRVGGLDNDRWRAVVLFVVSMICGSLPILEETGLLLLI
jgi:hypothetical protein